MLGIAVGNIGMPYDDFCGLTIDEFGHIYDAWQVQRRDERRDDWERMRMLACICIQPYAKKGLTPHRVLPLPWGKGKTPRGARRKVKKPGKQEAVKRLKEVLEKTDSGYSPNPQGIS